ncbi:MAG: aspartate carbamoyltransferase regulatory subunit [Halobacteria archaeon]|nr:aspartate carbamoyltransferase regulatory subunit [Halobacteria archaeon]
MEELRIRPIRNGTVIDHIPRGQALNVLNILGVDSSTRDIVSVAMNVPSDKIGRKDIVKVEGREIASEEADLISLIAPNATVNQIRDYEVEEKYGVSIPDEIEGVIECPNNGCITNTNEPVGTRFTVLGTGELQCDYCESVITDDVARYLIK